MTEFTPWVSVAGGVLIGLSVVLVMVLFGRIAGISGITKGLLASVLPMAAAPVDRSWRIPFVLGLIAAPLATMLVGETVQQTVSDNLPRMALAGLLVGLGTGIGSGCTSGHGVCGLSRLSGRSFVSVAVFMAAAAVTVFVLRHVIGVV